MMLSPVEHFVRTGHGLMMRSSKISTESIGLACAKLVRFLISQNFCNLTPAIEDDLAIINALNSCISFGKRRLPPKATAPLNTAFNLIQPMEENQFRCFANLPKAPETIALAEYNEEWERKNDQAGEDLPG